MEYVRQRGGYFQLVLHSYIRDQSGEREGERSGSEALANANNRQVLSINSVYFYFRLMSEKRKYPVCGCMFTVGWNTDSVAEREGGSLVSSCLPWRHQAGVGLETRICEDMKLNLDAM